MVAEDLGEHRLEQIELGIALAYQPEGPRKIGWHFPASKNSTEGSACVMAIDAIGKYVLVARPETAG
jgi:hypothetical protein